MPLVILLPGKHSEGPETKWDRQAHCLQGEEATACVDLNYKTDLHCSYETVMQRDCHGIKLKVKRTAGLVCVKERQGEKAAL